MYCKQVTWNAFTWRGCGYVCPLSRAGNASHAVHLVLLTLQRQVQYKPYTCLVVITYVAPQQQVQADDFCRYHAVSIWT